MSAKTLKIIAIVAMLIDHIAWAFVPTYSPVGQLMHVIGRTTAPIMCFFIAEGYHHSRNIKKYALRLGLFALISHIPFVYFERGHLPIYYNNGIRIILETSVIYTLFLGLLLLEVWNSKKIKNYMKQFLIILIFMSSTLGDWSFFALLWIWVFNLYQGDIKKQLLGFSLISILPASLGIIFPPPNIWWGQLFQFGVYLAIPLIYSYNGQLGYKKEQVWPKWMFYIFYPSHLLILGLIRWLPK